MAKKTTDQTDTSTTDTSGTPKRYRGDDKSPTKISPPIEPSSSTSTSTTTKISPPIEPG